MTDILGISAFYHDSAACLVRDGAILAAAQEERFTRKKQDAGFPGHAIRYCLQEAQCALTDLRYIVFYDKPLMKFERLLETYLSFAPRGRVFCRRPTGLAEGKAVSEIDAAQGIDGARRASKTRRAPAHPVY